MILLTVALGMTRGWVRGKPGIAGDRRTGTFDP